MAGVNQNISEELLPERLSVKAVMGGSIFESLASGVTFVLALVGVAEIVPEQMLLWSVIAMGAAFLFEGVGISMRYSKLLAETSKDRWEKAEFGTGVSAEFIGGAVGLVLGIVAFTGFHRAAMLPTALLVYGITLLLSSGLTFRLSALEIEGAEESAKFKAVAREAVSVSALTELLLGIGAGILGIIALMSTTPVPVTIVGMLIVGFAGLVTGTAVTSRMYGLIRR